jgi:prevent-host-death family protein
MTALLEEETAPGPVRKVTIRELQQHAARVIRELADAEETAEITSRGRVIARLIPLPPREDGVSLSDVLIAMREEERW